MSCMTSRLNTTIGRTSVRHLSLSHAIWSKNDDTSSWKSENFQLLQKSPIRTDFFQRSLPRLPIPKLEKTCERYLQSQKALLTEDEFKATEALVRAFQHGDGKSLDTRLRQKDKENRHTSYISGPWSDMYLCDRRAVCLNHNPGLALADDQRPGFNERAIRASNLLISALRFHRSYSAGVLYPDVFHMVPSKTNRPEFWRDRVRFFPSPIATQLSYLFKAFPLDMSQFPNLLQSTRIPSPDRDVIKRFPNSRHIVVLRGGKFFSFDVLDKNGEIFAPSYYLSCFRAILGEAETASVGIGALTSEDRDVWTEARGHLINLEGNVQKIEVVDSAIFTICLDNWRHSETSPSETVKNLICGPNVANRWFDKSFSLIFSSNGLAGLNFEHSWGDGVAVMRLINEVVEDSQKNSFVTPETKASSVVGRENVKGFDFKADAKIVDMVDKAKKKFGHRSSEVEIDAYKFLEFGKTSCKSANVGPDSVMQLAFQIAYHRLTGKFVATYESCSTAIFRHGRTETLRPGTLDTRAAVEAFNSGGRSDAERLSLVRSCSKTHSTLTKNAAQGHGWDRHLFALRTLAAAAGTSPMPAVFTDPNYVRINQNILSTSTLSTNNINIGGFCPVVLDGFGLGYQIQNDSLGVCVSSFAGQANGKDMCAALDETFKDISRVLKSAKQ